MAERRKTPFSKVEGMGADEGGPKAALASESESESAISARPSLLFTVALTAFLHFYFLPSSRIVNGPTDQHHQPELRGLVLMVRARAKLPQHRY
jgi:hypothetical protein